MYRIVPLSDASLRSKEKFTEQGMKERWVIEFDDAASGINYWWPSLVNHDGTIGVHRWYVTKDEAEEALALYYLKRAS